MKQKKRRRMYFTIDEDLVLRFRVHCGARGITPSAQMATLMAAWVLDCNKERRRK